jgi:hypothetical protein
VDTHGIRVEAPTALLGFLLVLRLQHVDAAVVRTDDGRWIVEVPPEASADRVLSAVQSWLDDEALTNITVEVAGVPRTCRRRRAADYSPSRRRSAPY